MDEVVRIEPIQHEPGLIGYACPIMQLRDQRSNPSPLNHAAQVGELKSPNSDWACSSGKESRGRTARYYWATVVPRPSH
jgi:hypothetical protein